MSKIIGQVKVDYSLIHLKLKAYVSELERANEAIQRCDYEALSNHISELNKIAEFDITTTKTIPNEDIPKHSLGLFSFMRRCFGWRVGNAGHKSR